MPRYFIKCGNLEVKIRAKDSDTAIRRFRAKFVAYEYTGTYITKEGQ